MSTLQITAEKKEGMAFEINTLGHAVRVDADAAVGGQGSGPPPKSLMLTALAGCTGMDVTAILNKMKVSYDRFRLEITGNAREEHPKTFSSVHVRYIFSGSELNTDKIETAAELSLGKYCPVAATLKHTAEITHEIVVE